MEFAVKCYYNTGLSPANCPESISALEAMGFETHTFPAVWRLQDRVLPSVKLATTYEVIANADYCVIGATAYWITGVTMLNENCAQLALQLDAIATIGVANLTIVGGWCTRKCVTDDTLFSNVLSEPFTPSQELVLDAGSQIGDSTNQGASFVLASVNLISESKVADEYVSEQEGATGLSVVVPRTPPFRGDSDFIMSLPQGVTKTYTMPLYGTFDLSSATVRDGIDKARSLGIDGSLYKSYTLPYFYGTAEVSSDGFVVSITSKWHSAFLTKLPFKYKEVRNNKAIASTYNRYTLTSISSGDSAEFLAEDIYNGGAYPEFVAFADPSPDGNPFCRPASYKGNTTDMFMGCVQGSDWLNAPLSFNIQSGVAIKYQQRTRAMKRELVPLIVEGVGYAAGIMGAGVNAGMSNVPMTQSSVASFGDAMRVRGGMMTEAMGQTGYAKRNDIADWAARSADAMWTQAEQFQQYQESTFITTPEVRFAINSAIQSYMNNGFWVYRTRLSDTDTERFDNFLSAFGYAVSEKLTKDAFTGRVNHNYVKADAPLIKAANAPRYLITQVEALITSGVRIWHLAPSEERLYNNPIKGES